jgi:hypothetical protein
MSEDPTLQDRQAEARARWEAGQRSLARLPEPPLRVTFTTPAPMKLVVQLFKALAWVFPKATVGNNGFEIPVDYPVPDLEDERNAQLVEAIEETLADALHDEGLDRPDDKLLTAAAEAAFMVLACGGYA